VLNVVYPLVPEEIADFSKSKKSILVIEEGQPEFIEQEIATLLRRADLQTKLHGKDLLLMAGEYSAEVLVRGLSRFLEKHAAHVDVSRGSDWLKKIEAVRKNAAELLGPLPQRPPGFCIGCPERPVFSAMKLVGQDIGKPHVSMDIGCHAFASFEPFSQGNTVLGYGMSLAASAGVGPMSARRPMAIMGDGGFWHNGLLSGVASRMLNQGDGVLVIMKNGYASATGTQEIVSSPKQNASAIEDALGGLGVKWLRTVNSYDVGGMMKTLKDARTTKYSSASAVFGPRSSKNYRKAKGTYA
jgi:indolepyruvate ferredoxin oxidoreductase alpha subunit